MKNTSLLLAFLLVLLSLHLSATDLKIPPKPANQVSDYAKLFQEISLGNIVGMVQNAREDGRPIYIVTVPQAYFSDLDTFAVQLCRSWQICGDDRTVLLILVENKSDLAPKMLMIAGRKIKDKITDEVCAYWGGYELPDEAKRGINDYTGAAEELIIKSDSLYADGVGFTRRRYNYDSFAKIYGTASTASATTPMSPADSADWALAQSLTNGADPNAQSSGDNIPGLRQGTFSTVTKLLIGILCMGVLVAFMLYLIFWSKYKGFF
jgi:hypothetical protein